jgi:anti-sigma-K factor RskA
MSGIKQLSVDQMAVLGLVLRQERPYSELAGMLGMDEGEMRRRAHEALDALGPDDGAGLPADRRAEVGDYLLGQQGDDQQAQTRRFLEEDPAARGWARTVADQLSELKDPLPEIPDEPAGEPAATPAAPVPAAPVGAGAAAATAPMAPVPSEAAAAAPPPDDGDGDGDASAAFGASPASAGPRSSRLGGALLLGGIAVVAIAAILFFVLRGGGDDKSAKTTPAASTTATQPQAQVEAQANLVPPRNRKDLKALGVVLVQKAQGQDQIVAAVQGLPKPKSGGYGIWLYSGPGKAQWLGFFASQDQQGRLLARGQLKTPVGGFREVLVTREAKGNPARPGPIFLRGPIRTADAANGGG